MIRVLVALLLGAGAALAEPLDTAEKFQNYVGNRTMFFHLGDGRVHAAETYLRDRRVRWSLAEGECQEGVWWAQDGLICFAYEPNLVTQCWQVEIENGGLKATSDAETDPLVIYEAVGAEGEQLCLGPKVGV